MKCWIELKCAMVKIWWNCLSWAGHELIDFQTWGFLNMADPCGTFEWCAMQHLIKWYYLFMDHLIIILILYYDQWIIYIHQWAVDIHSYPCSTQPREVIPWVFCCSQLAGMCWVDLTVAKTATTKAASNYSTNDKYSYKLQAYLTYRLGTSWLGRNKAVVLSQFWCWNSTMPCFSHRA